MATVNDLLHTYLELCAFCDEFQKKASHRYPHDFKCRLGCADCCTLESVNGLEAFVLANFLQQLTIAGQDDLLPATRKESCPFLVNNVCVVYPARPLICRTHGLPIRSTSLTGGEIDTCPHNFTNRHSNEIERECVLDVDMITANLVRLNMAFGLLCGNSKIASNRYQLRNVVAGNLPLEITALIRRTLGN